jgi:hypothetical protein
MEAIIKFDQSVALAISGIWARGSLCMTLTRASLCTNRSSGVKDPIIDAFTRL